MRSGKVPGYTRADFWRAVERVRRSFNCSKQQACVILAKRSAMVRQYRKGIIAASVSRKKVSCAKSADITISTERKAPVQLEFKLL